MSLFVISFRQFKIVHIIGYLANKLVIGIIFVRLIFVFNPKLISTLNMTMQGVSIIGDFSDLLSIGQLFLINLI